jgi:glucoamylase
VVDATIRRETDSGVGFYRYNGDGYGDRSSDGRPWAPSGQGNGHLWPVLAGERGQWELDTGDAGAAVDRLEAMHRMASGVGLIPEQAWELPDLPRSPFGTDPTQASIGFENGKPAGSASALTWSAGQFVRLMLDVSAGRVLDRPRYTRRRYVDRTQRQTDLTVTSPADNSAVDQTVPVEGSSEPGNTITVAVTDLENSATTLHRTTAGADGRFRLEVPVTGETSVLNIVATSPSGATSRTARTVVFVGFAPGTLIFEATDPDGDDSGPGNYAYPTSTDFKPGAFDIQEFQVFDAGDQIVFRLRTRDLTPTFGSALGAQLVDVYVHVPGAAETSTAAAFPQRNYAIADAGAWSRLIEVQGFGQRDVDAGGATLGNVSIRGNAISRYITFSVPEGSLGRPGPGWGFTVVLTGQDGFAPDQARGFAATPQPFQFGVCATDSTDPHCTVDPGSVPKAIDVLTPAGTSQADELDYTRHSPVTIAPVVVP